MINYFKGFIKRLITFPILLIATIIMGIIWVIFGRISFDGTYYNMLGKPIHSLEEWSNQ